MSRGFIDVFFIWWGFNVLWSGGGKVKCGINVGDCVYEKLFRFIYDKVCCKWFIWCVCIWKMFYDLFIVNEFERFYWIGGSYFDF